MTRTEEALIVFGCMNGLEQREFNLEVTLMASLGIDILQIMLRCLPMALELPSVLGKLNRAPPQTGH